MLEKHNRYDIIGDIHGYADTLRALLTRLGYDERDGAYRHPERRVIFVGDFIDRGPKIRNTLEIVRAMIDSGSALAVMGNHELNALGFYHVGPDGQPLRPHTENKVRQHRETTAQLAAPHPEEWAGWLAWFGTLPLYLDLGGLRVVHAAWCKESARVVGDRRFEDKAFLLTASTPGHADFAAVNILLKGPEVGPPEGAHYMDKDGHDRKEIRARWFEPRDEGRAVTYRGLVFPPSDDPPEIEVDRAALAALPSYGKSEPPVIFGHYWVPPGIPRCLTPNAACVDYSVASKRGDGLLVAYRWSGEATLSDASFVAVPRN